MRNRNALVAVLGAALVLGACTPRADVQEPSPTPGVEVQTPVAPATTSASSEPTAQAPEPTVEAPTPPDPTMVPGSAYKAAQNLIVKGRAPKTGYERDLFGSGWLDTDGNGCDTRNDILLRDLTDVALSADGCTVLTGVLNDPYTGKVINFQRGQSTSSAVQIDHMIPLSLAWQQGAQQWDATKRKQFANDPLNLLASDGPTNGSKSDSGPGSWLPPNKSFRCAYVARFTAVALKYDLSVNPGDHAAILDVLKDCPEEPLPSDDTLPDIPAPAVVQEPAQPAVEAPAGEGDTDPNYGSCKAAKAAGANTPYIKGVDPEYEFYRDGDGDGIVCE